MCLLAILYQQIPDAPVAVAANREEFFDRPFLAPRVLGTRARYLAGVDQRAGGTWLGVNGHGLVVAVTNRPKAVVPSEPRSRGLLCCDLLEMTTITEAAAHLRRELLSGHYAGANFVLASDASGVIFEAGDSLCESPMRPGLHLVTNGPANDPADPRQQLAREMFDAAGPRDTPAFVDAAERVCRQGLDATGRSIIVRRPERGTVSSTILALTRDPSDAVYRFAPDAPDRVEFDDYSAALRNLLRHGE
jgi:uncharacterized protein with NRDE domain